jgi:hypothetical protein
MHLNFPKKKLKRYLLNPILRIVLVGLLGMLGISVSDELSNIRTFPEVVPYVPDIRVPEPT